MQFGRIGWAEVLGMCLVPDRHPAFFLDQLRKRYMIRLGPG